MSLAEGQEPLPVERPEQGASRPQAYAMDGFKALVEPRWALSDAKAQQHQLRRLIDPSEANRTLHRGRNYLYVVDLETAEGIVPVVVKQFRHASWRARSDRRWRGSKAERSWKAARSFAEKRLATAAPVALIESLDPGGACFFVCQEVTNAFEARYLLRAANQGSEVAAEKFPDFPTADFLDAFGRLARRLHDESIWFRDLTSGNLLLRRDSGGRLELFLIDLNRARLGSRLSFQRKVRDLCRMPIHRVEDQRRFLQAYWNDQGTAPGGWLAWNLYRLDHWSFLARNRWKTRIRGWRKKAEGRLVTRSAHAHIPEAPQGASTRDKVVWDHLSDQPHLHSSPLAKLGTRLGDAPSHLSAATTLLIAAPRIWRRHRKLMAEQPLATTHFVGAGIALRPWPEDPAALLQRVDELGAHHVLLRLHPWEDDHDAEEALAAALADRGLEISFALPQNRDLVRDRGRWRHAIETLAPRFLPYGRAFQVGQAINRSKWGVWSADEYVDLVRDAAKILRSYGERSGHGPVEIIGPSVIDFEHHYAAAVLNLRRRNFHLDAVSSLLYVDRRGAPENSQSGFDTVAKVALLRAIAETSRNATERCWITEVNWPLREGPYSPAGSSVSVDEESQANFLVRYFLLALGTGLVERVFWWQMIARGYGLCTPEEAAIPRCRPAFHAFRTLLSLLDGATRTEVLATPDRVYVWRFARLNGPDLLVGWAVDGEVEILLPATPTSRITRDGERSDFSETRVKLGPSPVYFEVG